VSNFSREREESTPRSALGRGGKGQGVALGIPKTKSPKGRYLVHFKPGGLPGGTGLQKLVTEEKDTGDLG